MNVIKYLPHSSVVVLLALAVATHSPSMAISAVFALGLTLASEIMIRAINQKETALKANNGVSEETKRFIQDLQARVATLEYGVRTRGF